MPFALPPVLQEACESAIGAPLTRVQAVGGGDINEARRLESGAGAFFLKLNDLPQAADMLRTEARGLELLAEAGAIRLPRVIDRGEAGGYAYLLLEFIEPGRRTATFWEQFGRALADLHREPQEYFGLPFDNYIGSLPQYNSRCEDFPTFYIEKRLQPQLETAMRDNLLNRSDAQHMEALYARLEELLPAEPPALIHGDLWGGNFLVDSNDRAVLIDPATAYAHREMDLGMSRLFGGFDARFYTAYHAAYPMENSWEDRMELYQLYYLLVHVNLFGKGYVGSVRRIINRF